MIAISLACVLSIAALAGQAGPPPQSIPRIILCVDLAEDVDDAGAIATLHALADRGECEILAILVSAKNEWSVPCADAINTWYGRPNLPIGYQRRHQFGYRNPRDPDRDTSSRYAEAVARAFPHDLRRSSDAPDAALLSRRILAGQPDGSVTIVSVGFLSNLAALLDTGPDEHSPLNGEELVRQKVKQWVCMGGIFPGGRFPDGQGEYNLMYDTVASVRAVNDWPTPVVFSGFEIGAAIKVGARLRETPETNPVRAAYLHFNNLQDREAWDQTAVLFAVRGARDYWRLSEPGLALMRARVSHGFNEWIPTPLRQHRYLIPLMPPAEVGRLIEDLMLAPPRRGG
ncbi:MAG TPA: nucleoside hydrolase [Chthonomonadales bacterium]|nr:nucleoside hydrolase [Chthonomonadales bacterium]